MYMKEAQTCTCEKCEEREMDMHATVMEKHDRKLTAKKRFRHRNGRNDKLVIFPGAVLVTKLVS